MSQFSGLALPRCPLAAPFCCQSTQPALLPGVCVDQCRAGRRPEPGTATAAATSWHALAEVGSASRQINKKNASQSFAGLNSDSSQLCRMLELVAAAQGGRHGKGRPWRTKHLFAHTNTFVLSIHQSRAAQPQQTCTPSADLIISAGLIMSSRSHYISRLSSTVLGFRQ